MGKGLKKETEVGGKVKERETELGGRLKKKTKGGGKG